MTIRNFRADVSPTDSHENPPPPDWRLALYTAVCVVAAVVLGVVFLSIAGCAAAGDDTPAPDAGIATDAAREVAPNDGSNKSDRDPVSDGGVVDVDPDRQCATVGDCQFNLCAPATFTATTCPDDRTFAVCWFDEGIPNGSRLQQSGCHPSPGVTCVASCKGGPPAP